MASDTVLVEIGEGESDIALPNVFSPNGDAINDCYRIETKSEDEFLLLIYDRWGRLLFETRNANDCWDGNFAGRPVPEGVYFGTVKLRDCLGKRVTVVEAITLVR